MSLLDTLKSGAAAVGAAAEGALKQAQTAITKFTSAAAVARVCAVAAAMAYLPDLDADEDEIMEGANAIQAVAGAGTYDFNELVRQITTKVAEFKGMVGPRLARASLHSTLAPAKGTPEAQFLVDVAAAICDEPLKQAEADLLFEVADRLGVPHPKVRVAAASS